MKIRNGNPQAPACQLPRSTPDTSPADALRTGASQVAAAVTQTAGQVGAAVDQFSQQLKAGFDQFVHGTAPVQVPARQPGAADYPLLELPGLQTTRLAQNQVAIEQGVHAGDWAFYLNGEPQVSYTRWGLDADGVARMIQRDLYTDDFGQVRPDAKWKVTVSHLPDGSPVVTVEKNGDAPSP